MTFRITCPVCGPRDLYEFRFGGEDRGARPEQAGLAPEDHFRWVQFRMTRSEARDEWWYHAAGCGVWFSTRRNPATNREEPPEDADG
ncbi:MAG: sarcosine oxidase subunit delta [Gemmatimonadota bacterium]|nr:sarcosine oxidase subunit delta [Gemmatimonadota bacterium]